jgi:hypothetical protein
MRSIMTRRTDHPRTRGEHEIPLALIVGMVGSSPHAWGTLEPYVCGFTVSRIIPTRVGNTRITEIMANLVADHPHTRGEHKIPALRIVGAHGSSPHAWGTHLSASCCNCCISSLRQSATNMNGRVSISPHPHARDAPNPSRWRARNVAGSVTVSTPDTSTTPNWTGAAPRLTMRSCL